MHDLPKPDAVLYDWDNTLVDTWPVIHGAMNVLFRHMDMREWSLTETKTNVRQSMRDAFPRMFGDRWEEARDVFYEAFEAVHLEKLVPMEGMHGLLAAVSEQEILQGVVSNKTGKYLRAETVHLGVDAYFHRVVGAGDASKDKPAPEPIDMALEGTGVFAGPSVLYVGDSGIDMQAAYVSNLTPILIGDPEGDLHTLEAYPPAARFKNLAAFHEFVTCQA